MKRSLVFAATAIALLASLATPAGAQDGLLEPAVDTVDTDITTAGPLDPIIADPLSPVDPLLSDPVGVVQGIVHVGDIDLPDLPSLDGVSGAATGWCRMSFRMTNDRAGNAYRTAPAVDLQWYFSNGNITQAHQQNYQWRSSGYRLTSVGPKGISATGGPAVVATAQYNYKIDGGFPQFQPTRTVQLRVELTRVGNRCSASGSWYAYSW